MDPDRRCPIDRGNADFYPVQAIAKDRAGRLWVSVVRGGVLRLDDGKWTRVGDAPLSLAAGEDGRVWLGYPKNRIQVDDGDAVRELSSGEGLDLGNIIVDPCRARRMRGSAASSALLVSTASAFIPSRSSGGIPLPTRLRHRCDAARAICG